jgi:hypothetical protein
VKIIESLLVAISRLEGDALIMHVGEKPYVVTSSASMYAFRGPVAWGHVELSSRLLTTEAVVDMLDQLLPAEHRKALDEYGAVEYEISQSGPTRDGFTAVAARGGDDVWLEIRRTPATLGGVEISAETIDKPPATVPPEQHADTIPPVEEPAGIDELPPQPPAIDESAEPEVPFEIVEDEPQLAPTHAEVDELLTMSTPALMSAGVSEPGVEDPVPVEDLSVGSDSSSLAVADSDGASGRSSQRLGNAGRARAADCSCTRRGNGLRGCPISPGHSSGWRDQCPRRRTGAHGRRNRTAGHGSRARTCQGFRATRRMGG